MVIKIRVMFLKLNLEHKNEGPWAVPEETVLYKQNRVLMWRLFWLQYAEIRLAGLPA